MNNWQPIETAPKNRRILVADLDGELYVAKWKPQEQPHHDKAGWFSHHFRLAPTNWQPLPAAPLKSPVEQP